MTDGDSFRARTIAFLAHLELILKNAWKGLKACRAPSQLTPVTRADTVKEHERFSTQLQDKTVLLTGPFNSVSQA